jgi:1-acyl-sn-glycerol-3-phosphate acyltransferase
MAKSPPQTIYYLRSGWAILVFFISFIFATPIILVLLILSFGTCTNFIIETVAPLMMKPVLAAAGVRLTIKQHGPCIEQPVVYIINHGSTVDLITILALGLSRVRFVGKWELQYNPIFFLLGRLTGQVFIKRQKSERAVETLKKSYTRIQEKRLSVLMAPEGSRKHKGIIGPFKKGPFRMAIDLDYPIVPVYFEGNRALSSGGSMVFKSGHVTAHIYPPVDTSNWTLETIEQHIRDIRSCYLNWAGVKDEPVETEIKNSRES